MWFDMLENATTQAAMDDIVETLDDDILDEADGCLLFHAVHVCCCIISYQRSFSHTYILLRLSHVHIAQALEAGQLSDERSAELELALRRKRNRVEQVLPHAAGVWETSHTIRCRPLQDARYERLVAETSLAEAKMRSLDHRQSQEAPSSSLVYGEIPMPSLRAVFREVHHPCSRACVAEICSLMHRWQSMREEVKRCVVFL